MIQIDGVEQGCLTKDPMYSKKALSKSQQNKQNSLSPQSKLSYAFNATSSFSQPRRGIKSSTVSSVMSAWRCRLGADTPAPCQITTPDRETT
jgi:hypothetical protein